MAVDRVTTAAGAAPAEVAVAPTSVRRISWGAVLAGVIILLAVQLLLSMLGLGIGASTIDPLHGESPEAASLGIGAGIWWIITALIAIFVGSWVAGRLAGVPVRTDGMLHGLVTWGLSTLLLVFFLTTTISGLIGGAFGVVGQALQATGQTAGQAAQTAAQTPQGQGAISDIQAQVRQMFQRYEDEVRQAGQQVQQASQDPEVRQVLQQAITAGPDSLTPADRQKAVDALVQYGGMSRGEAEQQLTQWQQSYREAEQTAREVGEATADTVAQASLWSFVALALGAVVAAIGGMVGAPRHTTTTAAYAHGRVR